MFSCFLFSLFGFIGYEISVRIVDEKADFIERIGLKRYCVYLFGYGIFMAALGGALANAIPGTAAMQYLVAILAGYSFPSGGRLGIGALARMVFKSLLRADLGGAPIGMSNQRAPNGQLDKKPDVVVEEIADGQVIPISLNIMRNRRAKQAIEDLFGLSRV